MYDVIIVGAGVAGCYLANKLGGLDVLLIEKNKKVLSKDSGIVSSDFLDFFDRRLIGHEIDRLEVFSPSGASFTLSDHRPFAYILKRELFSKYLRIQAGKKAKIIFENVTEIKYTDNCVTVSTTNGSYEGKVIVGADGANSLVRKTAGIGSPFLSLGVMIKTKNKMEGNIGVFLNKYYSSDFFSWIIPQSSEYGLITSVRPREYLNYFQRQQYLPDGKITAHMIPTGYVKSFAERTLLVGDACGQNKPLTGGGIIFGLKAAGYAAYTIKDAFERGNLGEKSLGGYESLWKKDFAWEIDKQFLIRMFYKKLSNENINTILASIGPDMEKLSGFDYDRLSTAWIRLPKTKLIRAVATVARALI